MNKEDNYCPKCGNELAWGGPAEVNLPYCEKCHWESDMDVPIVPTRAKRMKSKELRKKFEEIEYPWGRGRDGNARPFRGEGQIHEKLDALMEAMCELLDRSELDE